MILTGNDDLVGQWVCREIGKLWVSGAGRALGWLNDKGDLIAGVTYTLFDGVNVLIDCAATPKSRWLDRRGLAVLFHYPFEQLGVTRVTVFVPENNNKSIKLVEGVGFQFEARLERAAPQGYAMLVFRMFKEDCRWLSRKAA